jgi:hypothetical protein
MNDKTVNTKQGQKNKKHVATANVLETLKDVGGAVSPVAEEAKNIAGSALDSIKEDLVKKAPQDFMQQIFGVKRDQRISGQIDAGEQLQMRDVYSGKREFVENKKKQFAFERRLHEEEILRIQRKSNELRIQLKTLMEEVVVLADTTQDLGAEVKVAAMQAPVEPGIYHVIFFEKLLEFIRSFRKNIEKASVWLHVSNKRAEKKNYWARYKKHGAKFLLSGEHYISRSAG